MRFGVDERAAQTDIKHGGGLGRGAERIEAAIATVQALRDDGKEEPRASTTDADARVMKMPDGGFRPAYNIQLATAGSELGGPRTIVGLLVTNTGSDMESVTPMLEDIKARTGKLPGQLLADANHAKHSCIEAATRAGVEPIIAIPKREQRATKPVSPEVEAWRERMKTDDGKRAYRARAALCELRPAGRDPCASGRCPSTRSGRRCSSRSSSPSSLGRRPPSPRIRRRGSSALHATTSWESYAATRDGPSADAVRML